MSEPRTPSKRSLAEWSYIYRRRRVLRAIRHPLLTPAAKQVLVALSLANDDPFVLPAHPPVAALAWRLALAERTVRQALAELVEQGCLTFRATGEAFRPGEGDPADPAAQPDLVREWAFLSEARDGPSLDEHLDMLARLRDHAVAARRIATAVSAERALGRALLYRGAEQMCRTEDVPPPAAEEEEAPLDPPGENLELVGEVNADRALAPAARHALLELMLDRCDDPVDRPAEDDTLVWSERLARRLGLTPRGARKALAELEGLGLIAQAKGDVCLYLSQVAERMRREADAPSRLPLCEGLDPVRAHVRRLERLRDLALEEGLASTALSAQRAVGRALGLSGTKRMKVRAAPVAEKDSTRDKIASTAEAGPPPPRKQVDILPFLRGVIDNDPGAGRMMLDVLDEMGGPNSPLRPTCWGERVG